MRFIVLTHKRSGTHMLCSSLSQNEEISKRTIPYKGNRVYELYNVTAFVKPSECVDYRNERILRIQHTGWFRDGCNGFAVHFDQAASWNLFDILPAFRFNYICLKRRNQLARYVSELQASKHNTWQCYDKVAVPELVKVNVDVSDFLRVSTDIDNDWSDFYNKKAGDNKTLDVYYEDLCDDFNNTIVKICDYIGVEYSDSMMPTTVKVALSPLKESIINIEEVICELKGTKYESMIF